MVTPWLQSNYGSILYSWSVRRGRLAFWPFRTENLNKREGKQNSKPVVNVIILELQKAFDGLLNFNYRGPYKI